VARGGSGKRRHTLIRTADAFGAGVALSQGCADPTGAKALRGSAGAIFRVPLGRFDQVEGRRVALAAHGGEPRERIELGECDAVASIPLAPGAESLNVAVAGAIALYEWRRRI
jgi:tRNA G18 (ribose-2'-O)-methylase SpoU